MANQTTSADKAVPQYVLDHAPLVYLFSTDPYRPSSFAATLANTRPQIGFKDVSVPASPLTLDNLDQLNSVGAKGGEDVYLASIVDVTTSPAWLNGIQPDANGGTGGKTTCAIIVVDKGKDAVDAFYIYFWAFNWGGVVLGNQLGDHFGDWEHNMIRFVNGQPTAIWYSSHANGAAYTFSAVQKDASGKRPIAYAANGSHALYPTPGLHDHTIPNLPLPAPLLLVDDTDAGPRYDPLLSAYFYSYTPSSSSFAAAAPTPDAPTAWLRYKGRWGDEEYPASDRRQKNLFGNKKFVGGPTGPADKQLGRKEVWPENAWSAGQRLRERVDDGGKGKVKEWFEKLNCFGKGKGKAVTRVKVSGEVVG
ncbi:hypothetical protein BU23DRAFT_135373, partial [Bimuria novae-zelandiae CBS 107.79]